MSCILIFLSKTIENILSTLKIIYISNHKKLLGSILNFIITLIWLISAISIINNFNKNPLCIFIYSFGCFIGTYIGCIIEEKLSLGQYLLTIITSNNNIYDKLKELNYSITKIDSYLDNSSILYIVTKRRKKYRLCSIIKLMDKDATITCDSILNRNNLY